MPGRANHIILIVSLLLGLSLGPWGLKQVTPDLYVDLFEGTGKATNRLDQFDQEAAADRRRLEATGVTEDALVEHDAKVLVERDPYLDEISDARSKHTDKLQAMGSALVWASIILILLEGACGSQVVCGKSTRSFRTSAVGCLGAWVVLVLAQPVLIEQVSIVFIVILVALGVLAGRLLPETNRLAD